MHGDEWLLWLDGAINCKNKEDMSFLRVNGSSMNRAKAGGDTPC